MSHNIIHHIMYVFHHHTTVIQVSVLVFNKYVIEKRIRAFTSMENIIFIMFLFKNLCLVWGYRREWF